MKASWLVASLFVMLCASAQDAAPVTVGQFQYEILQCSGAGKSVTCSFRVTNLGAARQLMHLCGPGTGVGAGGQTRAYDDLGYEHSGEACTLGAVGPVYGDVFGRVEPQNPVEAKAVFRNVSESATALPLVVIVGASENRRVKVSFKNVPIAR